ncbi:hypothetical protein M0804_014833 [Polistes exclamans]|nr:hypothetical protein M0804_014833 [Polistes exclamans]
MVTGPPKMSQAILDRRRITVSLLGVRVLPLRPRLLRCHRWLARGHVAVACPTQAARPYDCFVCGEPGHIVRECKNAVKCPVCQEPGRRYTANGCAQ